MDSEDDRQLAELKRVNFENERQTDPRDNTLIINETILVEDEERQDRMTDAELNEIIKSYADLLCEHMLKLEQNTITSAKLAVVARTMNAARVYHVYRGLTMAHRHYEFTIDNVCQNAMLVQTLKAELTQYENSLPYWLPPCKTLLRQCDRLEVMKKVFVEVATGQFDTQAYKDSYNPNNEL
jgi:hypothetical protein